MKTVTAIAERLVELVNQQQFVQAYQELYSKDAWSIDPMYPEISPIKGLATLIDRENAFLQNVKLNAVEASAPLCTANYFSITLSMDFIAGDDHRKVTELCVYGVKDGKIVSQQFFTTV